MIALQIFISLNTMYAYWLVTHPTHRRTGLYWTLGTEMGWMSMFTLMGAYGLLPISIVMFGITVKRLRE